MTGTRNTDQDFSQDADLMGYVDGTLEPEKLAAVEARLAHDAEARDAVAQWRHFDNLIHQSAREADELPASLRIAALERELAEKLRKRQWRARLIGPGLRRVAAGLVLFAAGWGAHGLVGPGSTLLSGEQPSFLTPTLAGHYAYTASGYEHADFSGDQIAAALTWISERMQQQIDSPRLERIGYSIDSARLMIVNERPIAVFYYRNPEGQRVTVSVTPHAESRPDYLLRVVRNQDERIAYWTSGNMDYAVVARVGADEITTLAAAVQE